MKLAGIRWVEELAAAEGGLQGKRVFVRVDFNVPLDKKTGKITDDARIREAIPTIKLLMDDRGEGHPRVAPGPPQAGEARRLVPRALRCAPGGADRLRGAPPRRLHRRRAQEGHPRSARRAGVPAGEPPLPRGRREGRRGLRPAARRALRRVRRRRVRRGPPRPRVGPRAAAADALARGGPPPQEGADVADQAHRSAREAVRGRARRRQGLGQDRRRRGPPRGRRHARHRRRHGQHLPRRPGAQHAEEPRRGGQARARAHHPLQGAGPGRRGAAPRRRGGGPEPRLDRRRDGERRRRAPGVDGARRRPGDGRALLEGRREGQDRVLERAHGPLRDARVLEGHHGAGAPDEPRARLHGGRRRRQRVGGEDRRRGRGPGLQAHLHRGRRLARAHRRQEAARRGSAARRGGSPDGGFAPKPPAP